MTESVPHITGGDVLEIISLVEAKTLDPHAQLTLLTSAISLVAIHNGLPLSGLRRGLEQSFRQTVKITSNFSRNHGAADEH